MSFATGPYPVVGGSITRIPLPMRTKVAGAVLQNISPLPLIVNAGNTGPAWLAQFQANLFAVDSTEAPFTLDASGTPDPTQSGYVLVTWFAPDEMPSLPPAYGSSVNSNSQSITILSLPPPQASLTASVQITMVTGTPQQGPNSAFKVGATMLADNTNVGKVYVGDFVSPVTTSSGYLQPGEGLTVPVINGNILGFLGTTGDKLSLWGA